MNVFLFFGNGWKKWMGFDDDLVLGYWWYKMNRVLVRFGLRCFFIVKISVLFFDILLLVYCCWFFREWRESCDVFFFGGESFFRVLFLFLGVLFWYWWSWCWSGVIVWVGYCCVLFGVFVCLYVILWCFENKIRFVEGYCRSDLGFYLYMCFEKYYLILFLVYFLFSLR